MIDSFNFSVELDSSDLSAYGGGATFIEVPNIDRCILTDRYILTCTKHRQTHSHRQIMLPI